MTMYDKLPTDPVMLLSFINTQLRDTCQSLEELADAFQINVSETIRVLKEIDYEYDPSTNQFI